MGTIAKHQASKPYRSVNVGEGGRPALHVALVGCGAARARRGEISHFTGIDDPYEAPANAELVVDTAGVSVEQAGQQVLHELRRRYGRSWS